jgi:hypothetical protein
MTNTELELDDAFSGYQRRWAVRTGHTLLKPVKSSK